MRRANRIADNRGLAAWKSRPLGLALVVAMMLSMAACGSGGQRGTSGDPTPTPLPTPIVPEKPVYTVALGTVVQTLTFNGRVSAVLEQELYFESNGNVGEVLFARGDTLEEGDVIARLDIDDLETELSQKKLSLQIAELKAEQTIIDATKKITSSLEAVTEAEESLETAKQTAEDDLIAARADLRDAEISLQEAQLSQTVTQKSKQVSQAVRDAEYNHNWYEANYGEFLKKFEAGQIDQDRLNREWDALLTAKEALEAAHAEATLSLSTAENKVARAQETLRQARIKVTELEAKPAITEAEKALAEAQDTYAEALADADPEGYDMLLLQLDLDNAKLAVEELETQITNSTLIAPFSGRILSLNLRAGDEIEAFESVGVLVDPDDIEITAELGSEELSQMVLDQEASVALRNRPGQTYLGKVAQMPYPYGGSTIDTGDDDTAVHVSVDDQSDLELGELATVTVVLEEKNDVLWLPLSAIRTYQGRNFVVFREEDGTQRRADVALGIVTDERVEITAGVLEGQTILGE